MTLHDLYVTVDSNRTPKDRSLGDIELLLSVCYGIVKHERYSHFPIFKEEGMNLSRTDIERTILDMNRLPSLAKGKVSFKSEAIELAITQVQTLKIYFDSGANNHGLDLSFGGIAAAVLRILLRAGKEGILMIRKNFVKEKLATFETPEKKVEWLTDTLINWKQNKDFADATQFEKIEAFINLEIERQKSKQNASEKQIVGFSTEREFYLFIIKIVKDELAHSIQMNEGYRNFWRDEKCSIPKNETEVQQYISNVLDHVCRQHDVKITRESMEANGYVDLLFVYKSFSVCMEVKRADHDDIEKSVINQLPAYMKGTRTNFGIYLVLWHKSIGAYEFPRKYSDPPAVKKAIERNVSPEHEIFVEVLDCSRPKSPSKL